MKHSLFCFLFLILVSLLYYAPNTTASPIINGIPDNGHVFKFHVSIHIKKGPTNRYAYSCGGSIISERHILTAAHCFLTIERGFIEDFLYPHGTTKIIAGTNQKNGPGIERDIIRVFIPSGSSRRLLYVDLAVAELSENLGVHQHPDHLAIVPLEVLDPHSNAGVNRRTTFCGFGYDILEHHNGQPRPRSSGNIVNRFMNARILGRDECPMFEKMICVGNKDTTFRTACFGDSGSGLIYNRNIVGVLSTGPPNCDLSTPVKFTRLYGNMRFIEEAQNPNGNHGSMHVLHRPPNNRPSSSSG